MPEFNVPRLRLKLALFALVGAMLALLPLSQVLRLQDAQLATLANERALLDPLALAVDLQRGLLGHRDVTDRVLQGRSALQPERVQRQHGVEAALSQLQATLYAGNWQRALSESSSLWVDWRDLIARLEAAAVDRADNRRAHRLLIEQTVQVMDDVAASAGLGSVAAMVSAQARALLLHIDRSNADAGATRGTLQTLQTRQALQTLQTLQTALAFHTVRLAEQQAALRQQNTGIVVVLALVLLLLALALAMLSPPWRGPAGAQALADADSNADDNRRNAGRRSTDRPADRPAPPALLGGPAVPGRAAPDTMPAGFMRRSNTRSS